MILEGKRWGKESECNVGERIEWEKMKMERRWEENGWSDEELCEDDEQKDDCFCLRVWLEINRRNEHKESHFFHIHGCSSWKAMKNMNNQNG